MFRYRLFWADGSEAGEAAYAVTIRPAEGRSPKGSR